MRFVLIDRITEYTPWQRARGVKAISATDDFFREHFPGNPVMPGVLIVETLAQTAGGLLAVSTDFERFGLMSSIGDARFRGFARPGDVLDCSVQITGRDSSSALVQAQARVGEREIARARFVFTMPPLEDIVAPPYIDAWRQLVRSWFAGATVVPADPAVANEAAPSTRVAP